MNRIIITNEQDKIDFVSEYKRVIARSVNAVLRDAGFGGGFEISVLVTDNDGIKEINREHRGIDSETDVLSFPMLEFSVPGVVSEKGFRGENIMLGDIVISLERALEQANLYGHGIPREIGFLTVHSMLHLLGFDHEDDKDRDLMRQKEENILNDMGLGV